MEMTLPGATGTYGDPPKMPTTLAISKTGSCCWDSSAPETCRSPTTVDWGLSACTLSVTLAPTVDRVGQVPSHRPSKSDCKEIDGSPLEKLTVTDPDGSGSPQSS